jgi:hypothetical protein
MELILKSDNILTDQLPLDHNRNDIIADIPEKTKSEPLTFIGSVCIPPNHDLSR